MSGRVLALVLAAGSATRFGDVKVLADLRGRPLLQHVLDAVSASGIDDVIVVLGDAAQRVEDAIRWRDERRVRNPDPQAGLSSSLKVGLAAAAGDPDLSGILVVLGDQPTLRPAVIRAIIEAAPIAAAARRPVVVPRYEADGGTNPTLIGREAWHLIAESQGDRGLGPILAAHPDLCMEVRIPGANPDVDTPADLEALSR